MDIVIQHIKYFRVPSYTPPNEFYPFTKDAIETVIKECDFHPRRFLSRLNRIVVESVRQGVKEINTEFVKKFPK